MEEIIAKTILLCVFLSLVLWVITNPSVAFPLLLLPLALLIAWALSVVIDD